LEGVGSVGVIMQWLHYVRGLQGNTFRGKKESETNHENEAMQARAPRSER